MKKLAIILVSFLLVGVYACDESNFAGRSGPRTIATPTPDPFNTGNQGPTGTPEIGNDSGLNDGGQTGGGDDLNWNSGSDSDGDRDCIAKNQTILILDFKSGWWSGDGGDYFRNILGGLKPDECGGTLEVEYHHIIKYMQLSVSNQISSESSCTSATQGTLKGVWKNGKCWWVDEPTNPDGDMTNHIITYANGNEKHYYARATTGQSDFNDYAKTVGLAPQNAYYLKSDINQYTEIWFLSGSEGDSADIKTSEAYFTKILRDVTSSTAPLFIGAGYGSVTHSNALTTHLGLGEMFSTQNASTNVVDLRTEENELNPVPINPFNTIEVKSSLSSLPNHPLFKDVSEIADEMTYHVKQEEGQAVSAHDKTVSGDSLHSGVEALITDNAGKKSIGVITTSSNRRIVLDAGLQRFYAIKSSSGGTLQYLKNIATYLQSKD